MMKFHSHHAARSLGTRLLSLACAPALLLACEAEPDEEEDDTGIPIVDGNNYSSMSSLSIPTIETASATDLDICWSGITQDIQCHDIDPVNDVDNVGLTRLLHLTEEDVEARLSGPGLNQSELDGYLEYNTDHVNTCTKLSAMSFFGTPIDIAEEYVESVDRTYMLVLTTGLTPGVGGRTMTFIKPTAASANTQVDITAGCGLLDFSANLSSATPMKVPKAGPFVVNWSKVTKDGQGYPIVFEEIDNLLVGFYQGMTVADLEGQILDMELIATHVYRMQLPGGRTADLSLAQRDGDGSFFSGFAGDGVWALGLRCSTCQNPAPVVLTIINPTAGGAG